jgi:hypothetical protein
VLVLSSIGAINQTRYEIRGVQKNLIETSRDVMMSQTGKKEYGENRGIADIYNKAIGNPLGSPYCQAGQYWCYMMACDILGLKQFILPIPRNGMANSTFEYAKKHGYKTNYQPKVNDMIIWRSPDGRNGHIERIISVGRAGWVTTVGFNTSPGSYNSQDNGDGVWIRKRNIYQALGRKAIRGLAGVSN